MRRSDAKIASPVSAETTALTTHIRIGAETFSIDFDRSRNIARTDALLFQYSTDHTYTNATRANAAYFDEYAAVSQLIGAPPLFRDTSKSCRLQDFAFYGNWTLRSSHSVARRATVIRC